MSTNNENYLNDVNGATFTSGTSSGRGAPGDSQVVIQRNPYGVRVSGRGARLKNKQQSPPASPSGNSINVPASRLETGEANGGSAELVFVLEIMSHTHGSTITNCCWAIGISSPSQKKS